MADDVRVTDAGGLIDPSLFPKRSDALGLEWAEEQEAFSRSMGHQIAQTVQDVHAAWSALPEYYQAPEADTLYRVMDPELGAALREQEKYADAARYLRDYVDEVGAEKQKLANLEVEATAFRARVRAANPDGLGTILLQELDTIGQNSDLVTRARRIFAVIAEAEQRCADRIKALDEQIVPVTHTLGPYLPGNTGHFSSAGQWPADRTSVSEFAPTQAILDGPAAEVREWWDTLTPQQRAALVTAIPSVIGNLNGVPIKFRADANRINLATEINRLEAEKARIEKQLSLAASASRFSSARKNYVADARLTRELERLQATIDSYEHYRALPQYPPQYEYDENGRKTLRTTVELVAFDPPTSSIATYRGPYDENGDVPDWVNNVAVHVPGTKTRMDDLNEIDTTAYDLYDEAHNTVGAGSTAMFAWAGGEFPQSVTADAPSASFSRDLGPKLRDFVGSIDVHPDSRLTVEAHSYGGAVLGIAEREGLKADQIVYVAGAGLGNDNTSIQDFPHTKNVPHYAMMARNDHVVGHVQGADVGELGHGASPLGAPGVTRLETGFVEAGKPESGTIESTTGTARSLWEPHSAVYTPGSTSFNNIVGVITGTPVEAYAGDEILVAGGKAHYISGITSDDYVPRKIMTSTPDQGQARPGMDRME